MCRGGRKKKREGWFLLPPPPSSCLSFTTPLSLSILLPSPAHPTPEPPAALQKVREKKRRRRKKGERGRDAARQRETQGWGALDVHEHAERRARGRAMTAMLSPKIRQTRRGRTRLVCSAFTSTVPASCLRCSSTHNSVVTHHVLSDRGYGGSLAAQMMCE